MTSQSTGRLTGPNDAAAPRETISPAHGLHLRVLIPLAAAIVAFLGAFVWMFVRQAEHQRIEDIARAATAMEDLLQSRLADGVQVMSSIIQLVMRDPQLESALRARDREKLLEISARHGEELPIQSDSRLGRRMRGSRMILS
jgi:hypothetical protein